MSDQANTTPPEATEWFYQLLGLATGPVTPERVAWMVENNHLAASSMIGPSATGPWQRLDKSEFSHLVPDDARAAKLADAPLSPITKKPVKVSSGEPDVIIPTVPDASDSEADYIALPGVPVKRKSPRPKTIPEPPLVNPEPESIPFIDAEPKPAPPVFHDLEVVEDSVPQDASAAWDEFEAQEVQSETPTERLRRERGRIASEPPQASKPPPSPERKRQLLFGAGGLLTFALLFMIGRSLFGGVDSAGAFATFRRVADGIKNNQTLSDNEWVEFLNTSKEEVSAALEPVREHATSDYPEEQALVWAGDQLLAMLQGAREFPPGVTEKFEAFMAEYSGTPVPTIDPTPGNGGGENQESDENTGATPPPITDPIFR
jgi:hypothetical protein